MAIRCEHDHFPEPQLRKHSLGRVTRTRNNEIIGPVLLGLNKPVHILQMGCSVRYCLHDHLGRDGRTERNAGGYVPNRRFTILDLRFMILAFVIINRKSKVVNYFTGIFSTLLWWRPPSKSVDKKTSTTF
ncbi:MAG: phosphate acyltransferase [Butyricimonas faecihominis]